MNWTDIQIWSRSIDWLNIILSFAFLVLPTLLIFAVSALFGAGAVASFKRLLAALRSYVDEPTDAFIKELEDTTGIPGTFWSNLFLGIIDGVMNQPEQRLEAWSLRHKGDYGLMPETIPPVEMHTEIALDSPVDPSGAYYRYLADTTGLPASFWTEAIHRLIDAAVNHPERIEALLAPATYLDILPSYEEQAIPPEAEAIPSVEAPPPEVVVG